MAEQSRTPDNAQQAFHEAQEQHISDNIAIKSLGVADESVPNSPKSTISAVLGQAPALEQESKTRAEAENLHGEAQKKTRKHRSKKGKNKESDGTKSNFKKAWKSLAPGNKKQTQQHSTATGSEHLAAHVQEGPASNNHNNWVDPCEGQPGQLGARPLFSPDATQEYFEQQLFQPMQPTYISRNFLSGEYIPSQESSVYFHHGFAPQTQYYQPMDQHNSSIILGGQVPHTSDGRIPSTFFTPTNTDSYAVAGRSRLVSGHPVVSQHAEFDSVTPYYPINSPITPLYPNTYTNTPYPQEFHTMPRHPGSNKPIVHFTEDTKHPSEQPPTPATDNTQAITVGLSAGLVLRESAIPPPLDVKKAPTGPKTEKEGTTTAVVNEDGSVKPKEEFTIAAFDGFHRHMEDIRGESRAALERVEAKVNGVHQHVLRVGHDLSGVHAHLEDVRRETSARLDSLEEKLDRVLAAVSAVGVAPAAQQQKKRGLVREREREVRPNLTGPPPHIPFGGMGMGMEGWYDQVKK